MHWVRPEGAKGRGFAFGHTFGVKVDGATPRGLWPPDGFAQGATAPAALSVAVAPYRAMLIKSALRDLLLVSYGKITIPVISRCAAPPYPASPDFPLFRGQNKTPRDNLLINPPLEMTVAADTPPVISTEAKRSGEISSSDGTGGITVRDLSTQSIIKAFSICPIPTRSPARDDGVSEKHWTHLRCEGSEASKGSKGSKGGGGG